MDKLFKEMDELRAKHDKELEQLNEKYRDAFRRAVEQLPFPDTWNRPHYEISILLEPLKMKKAISVECTSTERAEFVQFLFKKVKLNHKEYWEYNGNPISNLSINKQTPP